MIPFSMQGSVVVARFTTDERAMLQDLAGQLTELLGERSGDPAADALFAQVGIGGAATAPVDPALARLLPDAYRDDREAASEHRRLTERGLVERKVANAQVVIASLERSALELDAAGVQAWLRTLTDLRLAIAARLNIQEDGDEGVGDPHLRWTYEWLGYLQGTLVEAIDD